MIHTKNNFKFTTEQKNRVNRLPQQLLEEIVTTKPTKYMLFYKKRFFSTQSQCNFHMNCALNFV